MVQTCCVRSCPSEARKNWKISFHKFPKEETSKKKWLHSLNIDEEKLVNNKDLRVCSRHFCPGDYIVGGNLRKLKKCAVPKVDPVDENMDVNMDIFVDITNKENMASSTQPQNAILIQQLQTENATLKLKVVNLNEQLCKSQAHVLALQQEVEYLNREKQILKDTVAPQGVFQFRKFENNDKKTLYYTGFQTFKIMLAVLKFILPSEEISDVNVHHHSLQVKANGFAISSEQQFLLTMFKLRRGFNYETLGDLFNVSKSTAGKIFLHWINMMYLRLGQLNIWPHRDILIENSPQEFQEKYKNVVGSIDCTEFFIETPSSLIKQSQCYSNYKGANTIKSLLMTDPNGTIIYMSPLYTGSISDKAIMEQSGFITLLKKKLENNELCKGDIILADKGFNVASLLEDVDLEINIPTFRVSGVQFTSQEVEIVRKIAHERIHVERAISRLKKYRILTKQIPVSLLGTIEQVYVVCCILCIFRNKLRK